MSKLSQTIQMFKSFCVTLVIRTGKDELITDKLLKAGLFCDPSAANKPPLRTLRRDKNVFLNVKYKRAL